MKKRRIEMPSCRAPFGGLNTGGTLPAAANNQFKQTCPPRCTGEWFPVHQIRETHRPRLVQRSPLTIQPLLGVISRGVVGPKSVRAKNARKHGNPVTAMSALAEAEKERSDARKACIGAESVIAKMIPSEMSAGKWTRKRKR